MVDSSGRRLHGGAPPFFVAAASRCIGTRRPASVGGMIGNDDFLAVVKNAPLVSIDLVVVNPQGEILLGLRKNRPAQHTWFAPGGRIRKNETLDHAFRRISRVELGTEFERADATLLGAFDHFYDDNYAEVAGIGTHYVCLAHRIDVGNDFEPVGDDQHERFRWWSVADACRSDRVHRNNKVTLSTLGVR